MALPSKGPTVKIRTLLSAGTLGVAGLVAVGLLALPATSSTSASGSATDPWVKRDEDTADVVLVADDDDDDTNDDTRDTRATRTNAATNSGRDTRSNNNTRSRTNDRTGTGAATGRDDSRQRAGKDWTQDGPGAQKRDWSVRDTNDRSRHNTRR
jgi:hypothetical protein